MTPTFFEGQLTKQRQPTCQTNKRTKKDSAGHTYNRGFKTYDWAAIQFGLFSSISLRNFDNRLICKRNSFKGDLLKNLLAIKTEFWDNNKDYWLTIKGLIKDYRNEIEERKFAIGHFDKCNHTL